MRHLAQLLVLFRKLSLILLGGDAEDAPLSDSCEQVSQPCPIRVLHTPELSIGSGTDA
jgi:hypothetical protein